MKLDYLKKILRRVEVDHAVFFGIASKIWGLFSGPVTALLIVSKFTPELQGYYYTFWNIVGLQIFVELGLGTVITQFASHEWSKLKFDENGKVVGNAVALSRLISLAHIAKKWYLTAAIIIIVGFGIGGYVFFTRSNNHAITWEAPWFLLCFLTGINICLIPIWSFLEGCNQVKQLYTYRFIQGICATLSVWFAITLGAKLWVVPIYNAVIIICACIFLGRKYLTFLKTLFFSKPREGRVEWLTEMLSMQWRIAVSSVSGYFAFYFFVPVLFEFQGAVLAGQFGMTWGLVSVMQAISTSWLNPKVPTWAILIAQREYRILDKLFWRITSIVSASAIGLAVLIGLFIYLLNLIKHPLAQRILPPLPAVLLLFTQVVLVLSMPFSSYMRAHKKEPLVWLSLIYAILVALSTVVLGKYYSATGMVLGYFVITLLLTPLVVVYWCCLKKIWHDDVIGIADPKNDTSHVIMNSQAVT